ESRIGNPLQWQNNLCTVLQSGIVLLLQLVCEVRSGHTCYIGLRIHGISRYIFAVFVNEERHKIFLNLFLDDETLTCIASLTTVCQSGFSSTFSSSFQIG